ncbi:CHC2 zinc finger domain-containing protein [Sphingomonas sp. KC8]|uniref:CHC2 zinc finger domain-containing protein n=1 Tax=Sphingomonas sp. KC8 TaxID=1030157 RepID=UPI0021506657|nr:CHC2 zinc finger domain-containing protein [Sphingomonas sp. KC8]
MPPRLQDRIDAVREAADIEALIGRVVKLGKGRNPRGQCPFHGSTSDSFSVSAEPKRGNMPFAHCFGCGWHGDVIKFVADYHGIPFIEALTRLEQDHGIDGLSAAPVRREKTLQSRRRDDREYVGSLAMGQAIWRMAMSAPDQIRIYLMARGIPASMLGDERLQDIRFAALAPIAAWPAEDGPDRVPKAPAMVALVRRPIIDGGAVTGFEPMGLHVTYLAPDLRAKMVRKRRDGSLYPDRKMLGGALGGCVLLGRYDPTVPLYAGEGNETVLSGMAVAGAPAEACGIATLSLDNLQGGWLTRRDGALPLYDIRADRERPALILPHQGPVVGLIDADMAPLRGPIDRATGEHMGVLVADERHANAVRRPIGPAERARICAELFVQNWRQAGCRPVSAMRPPMGRDFNDVVREEQP